MDLICSSKDSKHHPLLLINSKIKISLALIMKYNFLFVCSFDDMNTEKLRRAAADEGDMFYFDPKIINWEDYFMTIHIPGVVKYVFK